MLTLLEKELTWFCFGALDKGKLCHKKGAIADIITDIADISSIADFIVDIVADTTKSVEGTIKIEALWAFDFEFKIKHEII